VLNQIQRLNYFIGKQIFIKMFHKFPLEQKEYKYNLNDFFQKETKLKNDQPGKMKECKRLAWDDPHIMSQRFFSNIQDSGFYNE
jgi:hypothetical protein